MEEKLWVTLIANAGLLLEYAGTKLLLDGIYEPEGHFFSPIAPELWQAMLRGEPPFETLDYLLFTHAHPDHFSSEMTREFLECRTIKGLFLPQAALEEDSGLGIFLRKKKIPTVLLSKRTDHAAYRLEQDIIVRTISTRHLDKKYAQIEHFCYLISFGAKRVLFTADVDYTTETFATLGDTHLRAAFVNPLFYSALRWEKFFKGTLNAEHICVYHVPFAENDSMGMRQTLARNVAAWPRDGAETTVLDEPQKQIKL